MKNFILVAGLLALFNAYADERYMCCTASFDESTTCLTSKSKSDCDQFCLGKCEKITTAADANAIEITKPK